MSHHLALAYTSEDQNIAYAIERELRGQLQFEHFSVDQANEGPILTDLLSENYRNSGSILLLISDSFVRNPNAMLHALRLLQMGDQVLPIVIDGEQYDPVTGKTQLVSTKIERQADIMKYVGYWQTRYLDLRRQAKSLSEEAGPDFDNYYRKIREISGQVNDFLHQLKTDSWRRSMAELKIDNYRQLFIFLDKEEQWQSFKLETEPAVAVPPAPEVPPVATTPPIPDPIPEEVAEEAEPLLDLSQTDLPPPSGEPLPESLGAVAPSPASSNEDHELEQAVSWIQRAWQMAENGDADAGVALLESGREALPEQRDLHYHLALMLAIERNDQAGARRELEELLSQAPDHLDALFLNGELYEANQEYEAALDQWEQLAEINADYADLSYRIGDLLFSYFPDRQYDAASYLKQAIKADPKATDARFHYALLCINALDKPERAIKELRVVVEQQPQHAAAHFQLAEQLRKANQLDLARAAYLRARELDTTYATDSNEQAFNQQQNQHAAELEAQRAAFEATLKELHTQVEELHSSLNADQESLQQVQADLQQLYQNSQTGQGQLALISGATSGIGRATAIRLAAAGYRLILTGRRQERLAELAAELAEEYDTTTQLLQFDVRDREAVAAAINSLETDWQPIDLLINNAGKAKGFDPIHEGNLDHWDEMIDTNLKGLLYLSRAVSPGMVKREQGMIINVCSTAGKEVYPNGNVYCATKHAVDALTHSMRLDLVEHGVRVGQICPAHVEETEFALVRFDGDAERAQIYQGFQPLTSPDVADAIYFMASQPAHVNILDMVLQGKQQASSTMIHRSGREEE
ncbi:MAG: SDR family NAD(P)-dependent oxidoreductase [Bacteroidota bacterium]